jgi:hypothetical protein
MNSRCYCKKICQKYLAKKSPVIFRVKKSAKIPLVSGSIRELETLPKFFFCRLKGLRHKIFKFVSQIAGR